MALAGLESCFRAFPPEAVAALVDCVLASSPSSTSPFELFRSLLRSFPKVQDDGHGHAAALSHAAALCHLLPRLGDPRDAMHALLVRVFPPLLHREDTQPSWLQQQAAALMCDAISGTQSWELLGATILPFCVQSCVVAMALPNTHE